MVGVLTSRPTWFFQTLGFHYFVEAAVGDDHFEQGVRPGVRGGFIWKGLRGPLEEEEVAGRLAEARSQSQHCATK